MYISTDLSTLGLIFLSASYLRIARTFYRALDNKEKTNSIWVINKIKLQIFCDKAA